MVVFVFKGDLALMMPFFEFFIILDRNRHSEFYGISGSLRRNAQIPDVAFKEKREAIKLHYNMQVGLRENKEYKLLIRGKEGRENISDPQSNLGVSTNKDGLSCLVL